MCTDLRNIKLFSDLPAQALADIRMCSHIKHYIKDSAIVWAGDEFQAVYCILSGRVDVYRLARNGREQVIERFEAGECFNLVPVFKPQSFNQANVKTVGDVKLLWIAKEDFQDLMQRVPELTQAVAAYFADRLAHMLDLVENLALFSVRRRLAVFLINQADSSAENGQPRWTQDEIARRLGTVRDVVGRALRKFEDEGLIRFHRQKILLLDRIALQKLAEGEE